MNSQVVGSNILVSCLLLLGDFGSDDFCVKRVETNTKSVIPGCKLKTPTKPEILYFLKSGSVQEKYPKGPTHVSIFQK